MSFRWLDGGLERRLSSLCLGILTVALALPAWAGPPARAKTPRRAVAPSGPSVTYSGFRVLGGGGSQVEVQLTAEARIEPSLHGKEAAYLIVGANVPVRNNQNPLVTREFDSVVLGARLVPVGKAHRGKKKPKASAEEGVRLVVQLREAVRPEHHLVKNANGTATLVVNFPKPSGGGQARAADAAEQPLKIQSGPASR